MSLFIWRCALCGEGYASSDRERGRRVLEERGWLLMAGPYLRNFCPACRERADA